MEEHILEVKNIIKDFPGVRALNDVSLFVRKKEIVGLIGENGAGKSTILKIINGIYKHGTYEGQVILNGREMKIHSSHDALNQGIGFVPQEINVMNELTVAENIFVGHLRQKDKKTISLRAIMKQAKEFLEENRINLDPGQRVRMLSIAQKQLLMIARALSWNPQILILDEPTTALAIDDVNKLFEIVHNLKENGRSIVLVTHKLDEITGHTDRVFVMRDGMMISQYDKEEYDMDRIVSDMVGRKITNLYPQRNSKIGEEVLRVEGLTVEHEKLAGRNVISDVSFKLRRGEVLGLVGLVGSGRTETLEAIFGEARLKSGKIYVNQKEVKLKSAKSAIKNGIYLATEDRKDKGILKLASIKDNIVISNLKRISNGVLLSGKKAETVAEGYRKQLSIKAPDTKTMVVNLSGGNQQKVILAKALNTEPQICLLDEPTKGIDVGSKNEIYNLINELAESGMGVIIVSSELPELMAMSDRFVILAQGKVVGEMDKENATQENLMKECFA